LKYKYIAVGVNIFYLIEKKKWEKEAEESDKGRDQIIFFAFIAVIIAFMLKTGGCV
jgi:prolipoprotein diacylglyceryltransferase